jgi:predicted ATPase
MSVEAIRLQNFMAFEDTQWIELKPICLLFGKNSSGKSVVIRGLRLLKQSIRTEPNQPLDFVEEDGVDVGSFPEAVHRHEEQRFITFQFRCRLVDTFDVLKTSINYYGAHFQGNAVIPDNISEKEMESYKRVIFRLSFGYDNDPKRKKVALVGVHIIAPWGGGSDSEGSAIFVAEREFDYEVEQGEQNEPKVRTHIGNAWQYWSDLLRGSEMSNLPSDWSALSIESGGGFLPKVTRATQSNPRPQRVDEDLDLVVRLCNELSQAVQNFLENLEYLGPIRPEPERVFAFDKLKSQRWERRGWKALLDYLERIADSEEIGKWIKQLRLGESVEVTPRTLEDRMFVSRVRIQELASGISINERDMGYGFSQVLPVIVQSALARPGSLVIIEQPELHLHPAAQAELGDVFIGCFKRSVQFILETHSENLLLRFRRRLAETSAGIHKKDKNNTDAMVLTNDDFVAYFVDRENEGSRIEALKFDKWGDYTYRPKNYGDFFGQDFEELVKMKRAQGGSPA